MEWGRLFLTNGKITLSPEQQSKFETAITIGIAKELHRDKMLTDAQLSQVLSDIQQQNTCALYKNTCALTKDVV